MQNKKIKSLKYIKLSKSNILKSVVLTLVKLCIIFHAWQKTTAQFLTPQPTLNKVIFAESILHTGVNLLYNDHLNQVRTGGNSWKVGLIDNAARTSYNGSTAHISDGMALGTALAAGMVTFALPKNQQTQYIQLAVQNVWITANLTQTVKMLALRNRPYTQVPGFVSSKTDDHFSFFSGHSAITATAATTAILMALNQPNIPTWGKAAAYTAGGLALTTAGLRIAAGKHYPSDVVTGILVGVVIAVINTKLHEAH
ncbi:MAG: phosphatase PAP2 family protein [Bacteroidetes bacterium]|nr:phosphatase PAP2 family protein [Bacteroidota bacterium]